MKPPEQLAKEHTAYMRRVLTREMESKIEILKRELESSLELYYEAMVHGFKHGKEDI